MRLAPRSFHAFAATLVATLLLVSCSAPVRQAADVFTPATQATTAPQVTTVPEGAVTPEKSDIQQTLDLYARAYEENNAELLQQAVDQENLPFRRLVQSWFDDYQRSTLAGTETFDFTVTWVQPREHGFVMAHFVTSGGGGADWLFRQVDGRWVISEPTVEQIGEPVTVEREHFTFITYPWADDVNERIITLMEEARQQATQRLWKTPTQKATVYVRPIYGLTPFNSTRYIAYYSQSRREQGPDKIELYTPLSYTFGFYNEQEGWAATLRSTLVHEYAHMIHARAFDDAGSFCTWMSEGLAEYVADSPHYYEVSEAVRAGKIIPLVDTSDAVDKYDLAHTAMPQRDVSLAYGFSYSVVAYIVQEHGGLAGFWSLARAYDKSQDLDTALRESLGVSYVQFDRGWRRWLQANYT